MPPSMPPSISAPTVKQRPKDDKDKRKKSKSIPPSTTTTTTISTAPPPPPPPIFPMSSLYGGGSMYGMMGGPLMGGGPLSNLNQALFGFQSIVQSLGQAVQIVGMNTAALKQLLESAAHMVDHAVHVYKEMRTLELASRNSESLEDQKRRRRLRALRWAIVMGVSYAAYKLLQMALLGHNRARRIEQTPYSSSSAMLPYSSSNLYNTSYSQPMPYGGMMQGPSYNAPYNSYGGGPSYF